jgi:hypothetical protein
MRLNEAGSIPEEGFSKSRLAVTLTSDHKMRTAWPGEVRMHGDAPWRRGEARRVDLTIDSKPFGDYVACWRPVLYACRDGEIIGQLELEDARNSVKRAGTRTDPGRRADSPDPYPETETLHPGGS